ncbi:hypothetical protein F5888DRAFT_1891283 [Russula emetica]|nr:hypothetical protein F5888DRAFT_1891283 [Russula emetica]
MRFKVTSSGCQGYIKDPAKKDNWVNHLKVHASPPLPLSNHPSAQECDAEAEAISADFARASEAAFDKRKGGLPKRSPWWDAECDAAAQAIHTSPPGEPKEIVSATLQKAVRNAKRAWADGIIRNGNHREAAKWRHGWRVTKFPGPQSEAEVTSPTRTMRWLTVFETDSLSPNPPRSRRTWRTISQPSPERDSGFQPLSEEEVGISSSEEG